MRSGLPQEVSGPGQSPRDIAKAGPLDGPAPAGRWELAFDRIGAWELDPLKEGLADEIAVRGDRLTIYVPINSSGRASRLKFRSALARDDSCSDHQTHAPCAA